VPTEESYSDYRVIDGIQVAFKTVVRRGEAVILERTLTEVKLSAPVDETLFQSAGVSAKIRLTGTND
jgi:hypothetical protein